MSRFVKAAHAIRAPLEFGQRSSRGRERVLNLRESLGAALRAATEQAIPPEARARLTEAAGWLEQSELDEALLERISTRLAPLLDPAYARRALGQTTDRLPGVGPKIAAALSRREIDSIEDLLLFLPRSYDDRRELTTIAALEVGHPACFEATVTRAGVVPFRSGRRFFQAVVADASGAVQLKWFRGVANFRDRIKPGMRLLVAGEVRRYRFSKELHHPEVEVLDAETPVESLPRIVPVYAAIDGVPPRTVRRIVEAAVDSAADLVEGHLPEGFVRERGLPDIGDALRQVHRPGPHLDPDQLRLRRTPYHIRLVAEELFLLQAGLELRRARLARRTTAPLAADDPAVERAVAALPFRLTGDQRKVWSEISADLRQPHPMNRLLIGDVGTGKTVVGWLAAVAAHTSGGLTAVLAPTEILAEQHARTFRALAEPLGMRVGLLTGSTPAPERRSLARLLRLGEIAILIGTHALLSDDVELPRLRLVVIDEQHRFGVAQRQRIGGKGDAPHLLVMTATPIPRTLALTVFGDLDHSVLRERPPGRVPVQTRVVPRSAARSVLAEIRRTLGRGEQAYVVYPLVEESEKQDLLDATRGFERLCKALPEARVALVHGRLDAAERTDTMQRFARGEIDVLVSTTVIEVGVDVANATLLVVQHAERFGLSQIHQLRGRVGRGGRGGRAILIAEPRTEEATQRLAVLEGSSSGFDIAEEDLRIRGAGEWLGTRQAGHLPELRLADLVRHGDLLPPLRGAAAALIDSDPDLASHPRLRAAIDRRWGRRLSFGSVA